MNIETGSKSNIKKILLVNFKNKILPIEVSNICLFRVNFGSTELYTLDGSNYNINYSLEELEGMVGNDFFRANRQYIISRFAIEDIEQMSMRKFQVNLKLKKEFEILIGKHKIAAFISWLEA
ncbi:LytTR family transcriptional regulator DNA-binding domain-containing protein [Polluticaenibacter yanchengensis]|uniref:LytTR family DNA-binding domain-containing protein n=1 Tax=Polluticaenibacter yanchengensis TaxID=3014562 RepID=A0ABT4UM51_9BACT|nr:LytTR family DNA-binding domain-containing protein [Chitinophagaceae bacterium LY-5]